MASTRAGVLYALSAYASWGLLPLYFHQLNGVPAFEVVLQRTWWALLFLGMVLTALRRWTWLAAVLRQPRVLLTFGLSAVLLGMNWLTYVWSVHHGRVLDASLGYFMLPLVNLALGYAVLRERMRPLQWVAVGLAGAGVLWLLWQAESPPWAALILASSFGVYGLLRKQAQLGALEGLSLETLLLAPLALLLWGGMVWLGHWTPTPVAQLPWGWLWLSGPLTAVPLLMFGAAARRIPLGLLGMLQYVSPTLQFALGIWVFGEPFSGARTVGFALTWAALLLYSLESWAHTRK